MRPLATIISAALLAGALVAPASRVAAQDPAPEAETGLGIRLLEAPVAERDDPRAHVYVVDHVAPGTSFSRRIEIVNDTSSPMRPSAYVAAAAVDDGSFVVGSRDDESELTQWTSIEPATIELGPRSSAEVALSVRVPEDAEDGEYYGGAVAEVVPEPKSPGVTVASRVAIRIYLSVGDGDAPKSDFEVSTLTASRRDDGTPVVEAQVRNTGGRALDMSGDLELDNGPAGLSAGPFPASLGTTLAIGGSEPVTVILDKEIPNGPWDATLTLRSGRIEHAVTATITFPDPGEEPRTFDASEVKGKTFWGLLALLLLLVVLLAAVLSWLARRRKLRREAQRA